MSLLMILPRYPSPPANIIGNYCDKHLLKIKKHLPTLTNSKLPTMSLLTTLPRSPFPPATCVRTYGDKHFPTLTKSQLPILGLLTTSPRSAFPPYNLCRDLRWQAPAHNYQQQNSHNKPFNDTAQVPIPPWGLQISAQHFRPYLHHTPDFAMGWRRLLRAPERGNYITEQGSLFW